MDPITILIAAGIVIGFFAAVGAIWKFLIKPRQDQQFIDEHRNEPGVDMLAHYLHVRPPERTNQQQEQKRPEFAALSSEARDRINAYEARKDAAQKILDKSTTHSEPRQSSRSMTDAAKNSVDSNDESRSEVKSDTAPKEKK